MMDLSIATLLAQDGITAGAIYALLSLALVLVYSVTRIPFIPIGGFVTYAALSLNWMQEGRAPLAALLLPALGLACVVVDHLELARRCANSSRRSIGSVAVYLLLPAALCGLAFSVNWRDVPMFAQMAFSLLITVPIAPMVYRLAFQPIQEAGILVTFMVSISVDAAMVGLALLMFGPEGVRNQPYSDYVLQIGDMAVPGQALWTIGVTLLLGIALFWFFVHTLEGKKLRATAVNRVGAQLVGIGTSKAGVTAFVLAATVGGICGLLIGPTTTINSASGIVIGLKGFVAATVGGFASYPVAVIGALAIGLLESFSSFWSSAWKDALVFTLIIPILLVRSLASAHDSDDH